MDSLLKIMGLNKNLYLDVLILRLSCAHARRGRERGRLGRVTSRLEDQSNKVDVMIKIMGLPI